MGLITGEAIYRLVSFEPDADESSYYPEGTLTLRRTLKPSWIGRLFGRQETHEYRQFHGNGAIWYREDGTKCYGFMGHMLRLYQEQWMMLEHCKDKIRERDKQQQRKDVS